MIKLEFEDGKIGYYEPEIPEFYDENKNPIKLPEIDLKTYGIFDKPFNRRKQIKDERGLIKSKFPYDVRLVLGYNCNLHCDYCSEEPSKESIQAIDIDKAKHVIEVLRECIKSEPNDFELWGGEPWVYFKVIKQIVPLIKKLFPKSVISTVTNGTVINREIADFIMDNDIAVCISFDGKEQNRYRHENPFEDETKKNLWLEIYEHHKKIPQKYDRMMFSFNSVLTKDNPSYIENANYIHEIFHDNIGIMSCYATALGGVYTANKYFKENPVDDEFYNRIAQETYNALCFPDPSLVMPKNYAKEFIHMLYFKELPQKRTFCGLDDSHKLTLKIDGKMTRCHNENAIGQYGKIFKIKDARITGYNTIETRKPCSNCPVKYLCLGECGISDWNSYAYTCKIMRAEFGSVFAWVTNWVFKNKLKTIYGDFMIPDINIINGKYHKVDKIDFNYG